MPVLTLNLIPKAPIKIPEAALSNNKWQKDKYEFYLNEKSKDRVDQGIYPLIRNTQEMFKAEFTRIDNQSNKGPQGGFYAMALQTNGQKSYTVAKLNVPAALSDLLTMLAKNMNKDENAYFTAIA